MIVNSGNRHKVVNSFFCRNLATFVARMPHNAPHLSLKKIPGKDFKICTYPGTYAYDHKMLIITMFFGAGGKRANVVPGRTFGKTVYVYRYVLLIIILIKNFRKHTGIHTLVPVCLSVRAHTTPCVCRFLPGYPGIDEHMGRHNVVNMHTRICIPPCARSVQQSGCNFSH